MSWPGCSGPSTLTSSPFSSAISASRVESGAFCLPGFNLATPSMGVHPGHEGRLGLYKSARMIFKTPHLELEAQLAKLDACRFSPGVPLGGLGHVMLDTPSPALHLRPRACASYPALTLAVIVTSEDP